MGKRWSLSQKRRRGLQVAAVLCGLACRTRLGGFDTSGSSSLSFENSNTFVAAAEPLAWMLGRQTTSSRTSSSFSSKPERRRTQLLAQEDMGRAEHVADDFVASAAGAAMPHQQLHNRRGAVLVPGVAAAVAAAGSLLPPLLAEARTSDEVEAMKVFKKTTPGVVSVTRRRPRRAGDSTKDDPAEALPSVGSGFVWDDTHVVTNFHVVRDIGKDDLEVVFLDPRSSPEDDQPKREVLRGEVVGADSVTDIAVIRVQREPAVDRVVPMSPIPRGTSGELEVGQTVYAIGNPFGLEHSMSRGIISGIARTLDTGERPIRGCIQTDASINPGNSGGPMLDSAGRVIGVNTAILTASGSFAGIGLAIPIDLVQKNVELLLSQGFVSRGYLGIAFASDSVSQALQLSGALVFSVVPGSPAQLAGVRPKANASLGDLVTSIDGKSVRSVADVFKYLDKRMPGDEISLGLQRATRMADGTEEVKDVVLPLKLGGNQIQKP